MLAMVLGMFSFFSADAQVRNGFDRYRERRQEEFEHYRNRKQRSFEEYRRQRNERFARYLRERWLSVEPSPVVPRPKEEPVPPVVVPRHDVKPAPRPNPLPYDEVIPAPPPAPQPQPVEPIEEVPVSPVVPVPATTAFSFYRTAGKVRFDRGQAFRLKRVSEDAVADAWLQLSGSAYTNLVYDCLQLRRKHRLCDWAYLVMLERMAEAVCGKGTDEAVLLMAYVYCQSGYRMRLAIGEGRLYMMFASRHTIYNWNNYIVDGERYYAYNHRSGQVRICRMEYPKERSMSLLVEEVPLLEGGWTDQVTHQSVRNRDMQVAVRASRGLLDFYSTYPTSMMGDNLVSRWAMYANMPMPRHIRELAYPSLRHALAGCSQLEAVNRILNFVQTGFKYEYDDKVWGGDRAFFPEESLYYPYCDCEDRSILLTRLVRDLLGLKCILVFYPGHLAAAVELTEGHPTGDCIELRGRRFFIADGTIIGYGAPLGQTMRGMNNAVAKVILLQ